MAFHHRSPDHMKEDSGLRCIRVLAALSDWSRPPPWPLVEVDSSATENDRPVQAFAVLSLDANSVPQASPRFSWGDGRMTDGKPSPHQRRHGPCSESSQCPFSRRSQARI